MNFNLCNFSGVFGPIISCVKTSARRAFGDREDFKIDPYSCFNDFSDSVNWLNSLNSF